MTSCRHGDVFSEFRVTSEIRVDKFEAQYAPELKKSIDILKTALDRWSAFLTNYTVLNEKKYKSQLHDDNVNKALEKLEFMSKDPEQRSLCEDRIKQLLDIEDLIESREALSKKEGIEEGREEGKHEEKIEMAKKMLSKNRPIDEIAEFRKTNGRIVSEKYLKFIIDKYVNIVNEFM